MNSSAEQEDIQKDSDLSHETIVTSLLHDVQTDSIQEVSPNEIEDESAENDEEEIAALLDNIVERDTNEQFEEDATAGLNLGSNIVNLLYRAGTGFTNTLNSLEAFTDNAQEQFGRLGIIGPAYAAYTGFGMIAGAEIALSFLIKDDDKSELHAFKIMFLGSLLAVAGTFALFQNLQHQRGV